MVFRTNNILILRVELRFLDLESGWVLVTVTAKYMRLSDKAQAKIDRPRGCSPA
jgi:hypothetical protein